MSTHATLVIMWLISYSTVMDFVLTVIGFILTMMDFAEGSVVVWTGWSIHGAGVRSYMANDDVIHYK